MFVTENKRPALKLSVTKFSELFGTVYKYQDTNDYLFPLQYCLTGRVKNNYELVVQMAVLLILLYMGLVCLSIPSCPSNAGTEGWQYTRLFFFHVEDGSAVSRNRIIFMRLRVKILMRLRLLPYYTARQNF
jgi:hypothetical protein